MAFFLSYPSAKPIAPTISSCFKPIPRRASSLNPIPPRDTVVDFGKYKGKMLGSLPSSYLKWVSKNLRAQDYEHWAKLADQVLEDPIYKDRIEWEFAESVLSGNKTIGRLSSDGDGGAVSALVEISERFGWDKEDKIGWSMVDFQLLGTTRGGRIPRKGKEDAYDETRKGKERGDGGVSGDGERRRRRRERIRLRKEEGKFGISYAREDNSGVEDRKETEILNQFPGREALLKKIRDGISRIL